MAALFSTATSHPRSCISQLPLTHKRSWVLSRRHSAVQAGSYRPTRHRSHLCPPRYAAQDGAAIILASAAAAAAAVNSVSFISCELNKCMWQYCRSLFSQVERLRSQALQPFAVGPPTRSIVGTSKFAQSLKTAVMHAAKDPVR